MQYINFNRSVTASDMLIVNVQTHCDADAKNCIIPEVTASDEDVCYKLSVGGSTALGLGPGSVAG